MRAATDDDERVDLTVSIDSDEEQPDEVYERGQQLVDFSELSSVPLRKRTRSPRSRGDARARRLARTQARTRCVDRR